VALAERTTRAELARAEEKARFEELRTAWEWGREQAAQTQAAWQQTRADWDQERSAWRKEREARAQTVSQLQLQVQDAAAHCQAQERALAEQRQVNECSLAELRQALTAKDNHVRDWQAKAQLMADRELELREMLINAHDQLLRRDQDLQVHLADALAGNAL